MGYWLVKNQESSKDWRFSRLKCLMFLAVKTEKTMYAWSFCRLKCIKQCLVHAFTGFEAGTKVSVTFLTAKWQEERYDSRFSSYKLTSKPCLMYLKVILEQGRCGWCNYKLKCRNTVFRSKKTRTKLPPNIFRGFEVGAKVRLMFWRPNHSTKCKWNVFSD